MKNRMILETELLNSLGPVQSLYRNRVFKKKLDFSEIPFLNRLLLILSLFLILLSGCTTKTKDDVTQSESPNLILATTTSTQDSGLLDVLIPLFQEQSGTVVQTVAVGTGAALKMAEEGNADVLLVHAPGAEKTLMAQGFGKDRMLIMHNDFVIVGPVDNPAGIAGTNDAASAFTSIAETEAAFISRGDDSGTNKKELGIWDETPYNPNQDKPRWYMESGQGMGATLIIASEKAAYTLTDRATYLATEKNLDLDILVEGDTTLLNIYHVITVHPERWPNTNYEGALAFAHFITSDDTQAIIAEFGIEKFGQPLFFPDADKSDGALGLE